MSNNFDRVYPFTTENISGYFPILKLQGKSVLTTGSSIDQAFNAILLGANKVTLYDINPNTYEYLKLKREFIMNSEREELYDKIISQNTVPTAEELYSWKDVQNMNPYLLNDESYNELKKKLEKQEIKFIRGNIFQMEESLSSEQFDRIIFSNILQYIPLFIKNTTLTESEFLKENFQKWLTFLKEDGIIQLMYYYGLNNNMNEFIKISQILGDYILYLYEIEDFQHTGKDGVVTYQKRRKD